MKVLARVLGVVLLLSASWAYASHAVNINTADKATLMTLTGIGDVKAQAIIDYRATNTFDTIEEVTNVSGIGTATYNSIKDHITVGSTAVPQSTTTESTETGTVQETQSQTQTTQSVQTPVPSYVAPPEPSIFVDAGENRTVIVGAHTEYRARAYNKEQELIENVRFNWNFGDGTIAEGARVLHHFEYPGKYVVVLTIAQNLESSSDRIVVTAEPAQLGFSVPFDGSVVVENNAGKDIDISGWVIRAFLREFIIPEGTVVLSGSSIRISPKTLGFFAGGESELAYPNGAVALKANQATVDTAPTPETSPARAPYAAPRVEIAVASASAEESIVTDVPDMQAQSMEKPAQQLAASAQAASGMNTYWWFGAAGIALLTGAGFLTVRRMREKEWDIIEES